MVGSRYATYDTTLAVDVTTQKPVGIGGQLDAVLARAYLFLDGKRVLGMESADANESGIFSFPDGKRLSKFVFYANEIRPTGNPDCAPRPSSPPASPLPDRAGRGG